MIKSLTMLERNRENAPSSHTQSISPNGFSARVAVNYFPLSGERQSYRARISPSAGVRGACARCIIVAMVASLPCQ
jgi:hypothetical protein